MSPRQVTGHNNENVYRAEVIQGVPTMFRKRLRWRFLIERRWGAIPENMAREQQWSGFEYGPWCSTREEAVQKASQWLDSVEEKVKGRDFI